MNVFIDLLILLVLTRVLGELSARLGQPASVGEILAGITIAVVALSFGDRFPLAENLLDSEVIIYTADIGIFCLMLLSGIDTESKEIARHSTESLAVAIGGTLLPLIAGFTFVWMMLPESENRQTLALISGIVMSITAVPAIAKVLQELGLSHTKMGQIIFGAALFDDVIGLFLLAILLAVIDTGSFPGFASLGFLLLKVAVFFTVTILLGVHVYPRVSKGLNTMQATSIEFSAMAMVGLAYGLFAESFGLHWILGAFMAGLFFDRARVGVRSYTEVKLIFTAVTRGMLAPLFFASIGMRFDPTSIQNVPVFLVSLVLVAFLVKIVGCGIPARAIGLSTRDAIGVGIGMSTRGAVGFVVLSVAYDAGLFDSSAHQNLVMDNLFSGLVLVGVVTTILVPILLRAYRQRN